MSHRVGAIILAAGSGSRIGIPKHRLQLGASTFLQTIVTQTVRVGLSPIVCVVGPEEYTRVVTDTGKSAHIVVNSDPGRGMFSSVIEGLRCAGDCRGVLIFPVDHPYVQDSTLGSLISRSAEMPGHFIKPIFKRGGGHPVLVPSMAFPAVLGANPTSSLRTVMAKSGIPIDPLEVNDEGVVRNINSPEDLHDQ